MKAKTNHVFLTTVFILLVMLLISGCEKEESMSSSIPTLSTNVVTTITQSSATSGGEISDDGNAPIMSYGICWSTNQTPTINDSKTVNDKIIKNFTNTISGLDPNTTYYVRAYATNSAGTGYGDIVSFTTLQEDNVSLASISTIEVTNITKISALAGGIIIDEGGALVTIRGVCWSTNEIPTINDVFSEDGWGDGNFTSGISDLEPNTTYYVRAYAINNAGISYGNIISFKTDDFDLPTLTTRVVTHIDRTGALSGGEILSDGGAEIISRGICWSTSEIPTIEDNKIEDGIGGGSFERSKLSGLTPDTKYYVRAYATNDNGMTGYGDVVLFTTLAADVIVAIDYEGYVYKSVIIGDQIWLAENLRTTKLNDGTDLANPTANAQWSSLADPGYSWYGNDAENNGAIYGALYNWFAVGTNKLCPEGWHVPSLDEWRDLFNYVGGTTTAGTVLRGTSTWNDGLGSDEHGFGVLAAGNREAVGAYRNLGVQSNFWTSTDGIDGKAPFPQFFSVPNPGLWVNSGGLIKNFGFPVRCKKDN